MTDTTTLDDRLGIAAILDRHHVPPADAAALAADIRRAVLGAYEGIDRLAAIGLRAELARMKAGDQRRSHG